ncbi:MAG: hypothetical protein HC905_03130 [Bacteroidales bacterium]|nr:hypothetical protein [Bacteroidales bacterium]
MTNRRDFFRFMATAGGLALVPPIFAQKGFSLMDTDTSILKLHSLVPHPVVIKSIDLLLFDNEYILSVTSAEGLKGFTLCNQGCPNLFRCSGKQSYRILSVRMPAILKVCWSMFM